MKVALVYDRVNKFGGAERVLQELHKIFPDAPLYTSVYNPESASWAANFEVIPSFLQKLPLAKKNHEIYPWLTPLAFESFDFSKYDLVISVTSAEAKGIITKPNTLHICYCLTPTRYLWSGYFDYPIRNIIKPIISRLRLWDQIACQRPDVYVSISEAVSKRIKKYYRRDSKVIYPPVDLTKFRILPDGQTSAEPLIRNNPRYYLIVSRLVRYKRIDIAIESFNQLGFPLIVIGRGSETGKLRKLAKENIFLMDDLTDEKVLEYYQNCIAVIFPGEDDFGIVPLEAQACGKPVIAFRAGGALETIIEGKTGEFFNLQNPESLIKVIKDFDPQKYKPEDCRKNSEKYSAEIFRKIFKESIINSWSKFHQEKSKIK